MLLAPDQVAGTPAHRARAGQTVSPMQPSAGSLETRKTSGCGDLGCFRKVLSKSPNQPPISACRGPLMMPWSRKISRRCLCMG